MPWQVMYVNSVQPLMVRAQRSSMNPRHIFYYYVYSHSHTDLYIMPPSSLLTTNSCNILVDTGLRPVNV